MQNNSLNSLAAVVSNNLQNSTRCGRQQWKGCAPLAMVSTMGGQMFWPEGRIHSCLATGGRIQCDWRHLCKNRLL